MERLSALIHKLKEQFEENVLPAQMLATVRQIESELSQADSKPARVAGTTKVAVMMPAGMRPDNPKEAPRDDRKYQPQPLMEAVAAVAATAEMEAPAPAPAHAPAWSFDPIQEIPTLAHQQSAREINDVIGMNGSSMNDRLRQEQVELAHVLTETPIRDLKKAIGVNDRYVFLNELFRGDETMYERSLKTLNGFRVYQEAEYWINRELKIKLGWNDGNSIVRHFYQLVRRRFS